MPNQSRLREIAVVGACLAAALLTGELAGIAQEKADKGLEAPGNAKEGLPKPAPDGKGLPDEPRHDDEIPFLQSSTGMRIGASMQMIAVPDAVVCAAARFAAASSDLSPILWPEWAVDLQAPVPLSSKLLGFLRDGTPVPNLRGRDPREWTAEERAYRQIVSDALIYSKLVSARLFDEAAAELRWVTFDHLWRDPEEYRGKVLPVSGRMIRLRRQRAPGPAQVYGIDYAYEAWVVGTTPKRNPYCILFTSLPEGLQEAETMDRKVKFSGYYIKKIRYDAADNKVRVTHLLIGPTVAIETEPFVPATEGVFSKDVLIASAVGLFAITTAIVGLTVWFRRGDRAIHSKLASLRDRPLDLGSHETDPQPLEPRGPDPDFGPHGPRNDT